MHQRAVEMVADAEHAAETDQAVEPVAPQPQAADDAPELSLHHQAQRDGDQQDGADIGRPALDEHGLGRPSRKPSTHAGPPPLVAGAHVVGGELTSVSSRVQENRIEPPAAGARYWQPVGLSKSLAP